MDVATFTFGQFQDLLNLYQDVSIAQDLLSKCLQIIKDVRAYACMHIYDRTLEA